MPAYLLLNLFLNILAILDYCTIFVADTSYWPLDNLGLHSPPRGRQTPFLELLLTTANQGGGGHKRYFQSLLCPSLLLTTCSIPCPSTPVAAVIKGNTMRVILWPDSICGHRSQALSSSRPPATSNGSVSATLGSAVLSHKPALLSAVCHLVPRSLGALTTASPPRRSLACF